MCQLHWLALVCGLGFSWVRLRAVLQCGIRGIWGRWRAVLLCVWILRSCEALFDLVKLFRIGGPLFMPTLHFFYSTGTFTVVSGRFEVYTTDPYHGLDLAELLLALEYPQIFGPCRRNYIR
jgi:hypothetical protein